jgi:tRNA(Arg) A34 adenosine deaminase TadA
VQIREKGTTRLHVHFVPAADFYFMRRAMELARTAAVAGETPVGCVITREKRIIAQGRNRREATQNALCHAEMEAINAACKTLGSWRLRNCTLYVTLQPCPMCAGAIENAQIPRVVYAAADTRQGSFKPLYQTGPLRNTSVRLLKNFFVTLRRETDAR